MLLENFEAGCPASAYRIYVKHGNSCWGTLRVEDKLPPVINCGPLRQIYCYEVDAMMAESNPLTARFRPEWSDGCGVVSAVFTTHKFLDGCNGGFLKRKWIVTDGSGNTAACEQHIEVINQVNWMCPDALVELSCKDRTSPDDIYDLVYLKTPGSAVTKDTTAVKAAYPFKKDVNGRVIFNPALATDGSITNRKGGVLHGMCSYYAVYSDVEIGACGEHCHGNKKVIRTWSIIDWCNVYEGVFSCTQVIKAVDVTPPTAIVKDTMVSTRPWDCTADFYLPNPWELHDDCDIDPKVGGERTGRRYDGRPQTKRCSSQRREILLQSLGRTMR
jgi:hypothetical protein